MTWKKIVADYFNFTRRDRIAVISLLFLIIAVYFLPKALSNSHDPKPTTADTTWIAAMKRLEQKEPENRQYADENSSNYQYDRPVTQRTKTKGELFYFDPNTLSTGEWQRLGLRDKTIHTIQNYLSKGGYFKKPEDLQKIYGLFPDEYERIASYIRIADNKTDPAVTEGTSAVTQPAKTIYASRYSIVDINAADTTALIALPGIGSKLAARIISFRDKLGGFYSISQVGETFGLPDSTFQKIKQYLELKNSTIRKININTATIDELKAHPYIRYSLANPIVAYRNEHGPFSKIEDVKKVMAVTDEIFNKIMPYLIVQ